MTNKEILQKAIEKTENNNCERCLSSWLDYHNEEDIKYYKHYQVIFSHEFAKAFFGKGIITVNVGNTFPHFKNFLRWQWHLMQMVREKEPLYVSLGFTGEWVIIITVHWYDPRKWIDPCTRRKKR